VSVQFSFGEPSQGRYREGEGSVGEVGEWKTDIRETENPNVSGYSAKRRFKIVDLPEPEGPEMTIGRVDAILPFYYQRCLLCRRGVRTYLSEPLRVCARQLTAE